MEAFILGSGSICHLLQHSKDFQTRLNTHVQELDGHPVHGPRIRNLRHAPHRFDSTQKPLGRCILLFVDAAWATPHDILIIRRGKDEAHTVEEWVNLVSEERLLQCSMLADAGDECMRVTRYYDNETLAVSETSTVLSTCLASIKTLFVDGRCTSCGYTGVMRGSLNATRTCPLKSGAKAIGGAGAVTDRIVKRCLQRMSCWVKLASASVRAEFPHWELLQAYQVFHIDAQHTRNMFCSCQIHSAGWGMCFLCPALI